MKKLFNTIIYASLLILASCGSSGSSSNSNGNQNNDPSPGGGGYNQEALQRLRAESDSLAAFHFSEFDRVWGDLRDSLLAQGLLYNGAALNGFGNEYKRQTTLFIEAFESEVNMEKSVYNIDPSEIEALIASSKILFDDNFDAELDEIKASYTKSRAEMTDADVKAHIESEFMLFEMRH